MDEKYFMVRYGALCLSNPMCVTANHNGYSGFKQEPITIDNIYSSGSTPVRSTTKEKNISISGSFRVPDSSNLHIDDIKEAYEIGLQKERRFFTVAKRWRNVFDLQKVGVAFTAGSDTTAVTYNQDWQIVTGGSQEFDLSGAANAAGISRGGFSTDLTDIALQGNWECYVYIPDVTHIERVAVRFGTSFGNRYIAPELATQSDGSAMENGWNHFSFSWADCTTAGTPDPANTDWMRFDLIYSDDQEAMTGVRFGGLYWIDDDRCRNYRSMPQGVRYQALHYEGQRQDFSTGFLAYEGGESTTRYTALEITGETDISQEVLIDFGGSVNPKPITTIDMNTVASVTTVRLENKTTNQSAAFISNTGFTDGDSFVFDLENLTAKHNGADTDVEYLLPRFAPGINRINLSFEAAAAETFELADSTAILDGDILERHAQSFTPTAPGVVSNIAFNLTNWRKVSGQSTTNVGFIAAIYSDTGGNLPDTLIGSSVFYPGPSTDGFVTSEGFMNVPVLAGTRYWAVIHTTFEFPGFFKYAINVRNNAITGGIPGERRAQYTGGAWITVDHDLPTVINIIPSVTIDYNVVTTYKKLYP